VLPLLDRSRIVHAVRIMTAKEGSADGHGRCACSTRRGSLVRASQLWPYRHHGTVPHSLEYQVSEQESEQWVWSFMPLRTGRPRVVAGQELLLAWGFLSFDRLSLSPKPILINSLAAMVLFYCSV
jgi:hypothetical protein